MAYETYFKDNYKITTDPTSTDVDSVCSMLAKSYWANQRKRNIIEKSIQNSMCFNLFDGDKQIGFARMVTDRATYAFLCDVFIDESHRELGLGKWLMECIFSHPDFKEIRITQLITKDAHGLYSKYGFIPPAHPENMMMRFIEK